MRLLRQGTDIAAERQAMLVDFPEDTRHSLCAHDRALLTMGVWTPWQSAGSMRFQGDFAGGSLIMFYCFVSRV